MSEPGKYIRYIYNRLILENATVRAAAVSALSSFAADGASNSLRKSVAVLLRQSLMDSDDEVRDRATFFTKSLGLQSLQESNATDSGDESVENLQEDVKKLLSLNCPVVNLEAELLAYVASGNGEVEFSIESVSKAAMTSVGTGSVMGAAMDSERGMGMSVAPKTTTVDLSAEVIKIPEFSGLGRPFKSSIPKDLTEAETEYTAKVVVHAYENQIVLEFICVNTLNDQLLENVYIEVDTSQAVGLGDMTIIPAARLPYGEPTRTYVGISRNDDGFPSGELACKMKFAVKDVDPTTGEADEEGYDDEYGLDALTLMTSHLMSRPAELPSSFKAAWEALGPDNELADSFLLEEHENVPSAVAATIDLLGMAPCESTERVSDRARSHILLLTGVFVPGVQVMMHAKFVVTPECVALETVLRSEDAAVSEMLINSISGSD